MENLKMIVMVMLLTILIFLLPCGAFADSNKRTYIGKDISGTRDIDFIIDHNMSNQVSILQESDHDLKIEKNGIEKTQSELRFNQDEVVENQYAEQVNSKDIQAINELPQQDSPTEAKIQKVSEKSIQYSNSPTELLVIERTPIPEKSEYKMIGDPVIPNMKK
jgi:hypothetical protein